MAGLVRTVSLVAGSSNANAAPEPTAENQADAEASAGSTTAAPRSCVTTFGEGSRAAWASRRRSRTSVGDERMGESSANATKEATKSVPNARDRRRNDGEIVGFLRVFISGFLRFRRFRERSVRDAILPFTYRDVV